MAKKLPQETEVKEPEVKEPEVKEPEAKQPETQVVTVKVRCAALGEGDATYLKGETFTTTAARAAALGDSVEIV